MTILNASSGLWFDEAAANQAVQFFETVLRHSKGEWAGQPFKLLDWQRDQVIRPVFGWKRADGTRRYRRAYVEVPKKNGKSTLCAGIALYLLTFDNEPGAEVYTAAADRDQASIVFNEAANMVEAAPGLYRRCNVRRANKTIEYRGTRSVLKALSAEVPTKHGLNISGLVFDELHAQKTPELWDTLKYGGRSRRQPLLFAITTAGYDRESLCWEQHCYAEGILNGTIEDDSYFALIYAANPEDDWTGEDTWRKANPSYGITIKPDAIAEECQSAQKIASEENTFKRLTLNIWTEQDVRAITLRDWDACKRVIHWDRLPQVECFAGIDLASSLDLTSLVLAFGFGYKYLLLPFFWVPERACKERERLNKVRFDNWARRGHVFITRGERLDQRAVRTFVNELASRFSFREIAIDRWNASQLTQDLSDDGFEMVPFGQGYASISSPTKEFEALVVSRHVFHDGHPVLRWNVGNMAFELDPAGNPKPSKKKSLEKIDGAVASIMALALAMRRQESGYTSKGIEVIGDESLERGPSIYETKGIEVV